MILKSNLLRDLGSAKKVPCFESQPKRDSSSYVPFLKNRWSAMMGRRFAEFNHFQMLIWRKFRLVSSHALKNLDTFP